MRVSTHLAVGVLALAVGAAGSAGAAQLLTGADIKNGSIGLVDLSKKARQALKGERGPRGNSAPAPPSLIFGSSSVEDGTDINLTPSGGLGRVPVPAGGSLSARDLAFRSTAAPGAGNSYTLVFQVNEADTALACTISDAARSCTARSALAPVSGQLVNLRLTESGTPGPANVAWTFRIVPSPQGPG